MPPINYILDFETVVADVRECYGKSFSKAFREFGIPYDEKSLDEYISTPMDVLFGRHYRGCTCKYRDFVIMFMGEFDRQFALTVRPYGGIVDWMKAASSSGSRIGIVSDIAGIYIEMFLDTNGLKRCVSSVVGVDRTFVAKPDPFALRTCLGEIEGTAEDTVVVSRNDSYRPMCGKLPIRLVAELHP